MAASDAKPIPIKNEAYRVTFPILDGDGDLVSGAAGLDCEYSGDAGAFDDCTNEAIEIATSSGIYYLDLTAAEMNYDTVAVLIKTSTSGAKTTPIVFYPAEDTDIPVNITAIAAAALDDIHDEVVEGSLTHREIERIILSALAGKSSGGGTPTLKFRDVADTKDRISVTVDEDGNRTAVSLDGS